MLGEIVEDAIAYRDESITSPSSSGPKLERYARALERLELGTDLFRSMEAAQARTKHRFDELHGHEHGDGPNGR